jgi:hypothetical protein
MYSFYVIICQYKTIDQFNVIYNDQNKLSAVLQSD